ncbi:MAG: hypothetical protein KTQ12_09210 [Dermatophilaceae bacterium]|nr:hypothetical protein [Dermatophilaceae bacterium]
MTVTQGPWIGPPVKQPALGQRRWWKRVDGRLFVWLKARWVAAPVPMADPSEPIPNRPPNPDRITAALDMNMMDGPEVDEALGVANAFDTVVDSWEAGDVIPTVDEVRRLATLTGYPVGWFFAGSMPRIDSGWICGGGSRGCQSIADPPANPVCPHCGAPAEEDA